MCPTGWLVGNNLLGVLDEEFDLLDTGWWHVDGCSGYCPDCFQRPWCEFGIQSRWQEDEKLGKMFLTESVRRYVPASPQSLAILRIYQEKEDREFAEFKAKNDGKLKLDLLPPFDEFDGDLPF